MSTTTNQNVPADSISQDEKKIKGEIVYIPVEKLHPHEDNPRKAVGDVTELAESIKANGILQNLTVVPATGYYHGDYTVIIGHRRLAAAKLAGLTEVPCVVVEMTPKEQVSTMLTENMQRTDLTLYEQAKGFQMMIDFGDTVEEVAEKSGFSETTVRRRLKLAKLKDKESFEQAQFRGGTIEDFIEIAEIKDEKTREDLTAAVGTSSFSWKLSVAKEDQAFSDTLPDIRNEMTSIGATEDKSARSWNSDKVLLAEIKIKDFKRGCTDSAVSEETRELVWNADKYSLRIFALRSQEERAAKTEAEAKRKTEKQREKRNQLEAASRRAYRLRKDAINSFSESVIKEHLADVAAALYKDALDSYNGFTLSDVEEIFGLEDFNTDDMTDEQYEDFLNDRIETYTKTHPAQAILQAVCAMLCIRKESGYYSYNAEYKADATLDILYELLTALGYEMSDEEKALQDGTHELFKDEEETNVGKEEI